MDFTYRTVSKESTSQIKEKGSRFIAFLFPIQNEKEFKKRVSGLKTEFPDAVHHCFAFRLNEPSILERFSDDGEPSGTAGKPILGQLKSADISNCALVVVRYFGGIKLGTGGLIKAYKSVAKQVIESSNIITEEIKAEAIIQCKFEQSGTVMGLLKKHRVEILKKKGSELLEIQVRIPKSEINELEKVISQMETCKIIHLLQ